MVKWVRALLVIGTLLAGWAHAGPSEVLTNEDWDAAARIALAFLERNGEAIVVLDDKLSPDARSALQRLRRTTIMADLPEQEKYVLPPGGYLLVSQFEPQGDGFAFSGTRGVVPRNAGLNCGVTLKFVMTRDGNGAWARPQRWHSIVC